MGQFARYRIALAPEFLSSPKFLKRPRVVPAYTVSVHAGFPAALPRGIPATSVFIPADFPRNPQDFRHPRSRAGRLLGLLTARDLSVTD